MCGIIHVRSLDGQTASGRVWRRYLHQQARGREGYGFLTVEGKRLGSYQRFQNEEDAKKALVGEKAHEIIFHHRLPTSTANVPEAAHPIKVKHRSLKHIFFVVHNGIIWNADTLKVVHDVKGFKYTTEVSERIQYQAGRKKYYSEAEARFNDSEALAIDLALTLSGKQAKMEARGSIAFICLEADKDGTPLYLHYGRNASNPLVVEQRKELVAIKSQGGGEKVEEHKLYSYSYATGETTMKDFDVGAKYLSPYPSTATTPTALPAGTPPLTPVTHFDESADDEYGEYWPRKRRTAGFKSETAQLAENALEIKRLAEELEQTQQMLEDMKEESEWYKDCQEYEAMAQTEAEIAILRRKAENLETELTIITNENVYF